MTALLLGAAASLGAQNRPPDDSLQVVDSADAPPPAVELARLRLGSDSLTTVPGRIYSAGAVRRFFLGGLNRRLWSIPVTVPVLDLDSVGGGLVVDEPTEEDATLGLRLRGRNGVTYRFRALIASPGRAIPSPLRSTPVEDVLQDQMAARFPLSALVVTELLEAAGVPATKPRPVILPDDPRLGDVRSAFAGRMGWIEVWPEGGSGEVLGLPSTVGIHPTPEVLDQVRADPRVRVDAEALLKARLVDMFVGDWDRDSDQWLWARFDEAGGGARWEPVPVDRDWALSRIDGMLPTLTSVYFPRYVGFDAEYPDVVKLAWTGQRLDRTFLTALDERAFLRVAGELQRAFPDSVLTRAVDALPGPYGDAVGEHLTAALRRRRDGLVDLASRYYHLLARWVDVEGTDAADSVVVSPSPGRVRVRMVAPDHGGVVRFDRTFTEDETREVRLYLGQGDDRVVIEGPGPLPIGLRIVGGAGDDRFLDGTDGSGVLLYDDEGANRVEMGDQALVTDDVLLVQDSLRAADAVWETRDWGTALVPRPELRWNSDLGLFVGAGLDRYRFGFGTRPWASRWSLSVLNGLRADRWIVESEMERALGSGGWRGAVRFDLFTRKPTWFFGIEEVVATPEDEDAYRSVRDHLSLGAELRFVADTTWSVAAGATLSHAGAVEPGGRLFDERDPYGSGDFTDLGLHAGLEFDTRDRPSLPTRGFRGDLELRVHPALFDVRDTFGGLQSTLVGITSAGPVAFQAALHGRALGRRFWGRAPYHRLPSLGGSSTLPGYVERRYLGHSVASAAGLVRVRVADVHLVSDLVVGVHTLGVAGRVWRNGVDPEDRVWHRGLGGGVWIHAPSIDRTISLTVVQGSGAPRTYLGFGSLF